MNHNRAALNRIVESLVANQVISQDKEKEALDLLLKDLAKNFFDVSLVGDIALCLDLHFDREDLAEHGIQFDEKGVSFIPDDFCRDVWEFLSEQDDFYSRLTEAIKEYLEDE